MEEELFETTPKDNDAPLAMRMRPHTLEEYVGQEHIIGEGRLLRRAIKADQLSSLIFYGPPGTGKTTLAGVIANTTKSYFASLNAVLTGVKDLRETIEKAKQNRQYYDRKTILFVDEVHRWNKAQQDALLPWVENGTVVLIGATTENPFFEVNRTLLSRSRIFQLTPLTKQHLFTVAHNAVTDRERGYGRYEVTFEKGALEHLVDVADGDARTLLNALELAVETTPSSFPPSPGEVIHVSMETAEESIRKKVVLYDKEGDYHFDTISAFIKSIRGSDPDAALYWLARMVEAGEDPRFLFRRMLILASEDVGMADPHALSVVEAAAAAFDRIGLPEGRFHLTHAALYLATAPKSNSTLGFFDALEAVRKEATYEVPDHLKDANRDKEGFGHGEGYLYPHAYRDHWVAQQYLPDGLKGALFYDPSGVGYEGRIREEVRRKREVQLEAALDPSSQELLTYTPPDKQRERWLQRTIENRGETLSDIRERLFEQLTLPRYARILVAGNDSGLLLWEAFRRVPEGGVWTLVASEDRQEMIEYYNQSLPEHERPVILSGDIMSFGDVKPEEGGSSIVDDDPSPTGRTPDRAPSALRFETVIGRDTLLRLEDKQAAINIIYKLLVTGGRLSLAESMPAQTTRISSLLADALENEGLLVPVQKAEEQMYSGSDSPLTNWSRDTLESNFHTAGFAQLESYTHVYNEQRSIREDEIERWFVENQEKSSARSARIPGERSRTENGSTTGPGLSYGDHLCRLLSRQQVDTVKTLMIKHLAGTTVDWEKTVLFVYGKK